VADGVVAVHVDLPGRAATTVEDDRRGPLGRAVLGEVLGWIRGDDGDVDGCTLADRVPTATGPRVLLGLSNGGNLAMATLADPTLAMLELSKGKLTSSPDAHSGHGLFFTSRLADVFDLHANRRAFQYRGWDRRSWHTTKAIPRDGTSIYLAVNLDTARTLDSVLRAHSVKGDRYTFETTSVPLQLMTGLHTGLESRAQAKRVASRLQRFRRAEIDFSGIQDVGHGFADELFRVFSRQNVGVEIVPVGMAPRVAAMIASVREAAAETA
jgi:hypothetical protein